MTSESIVHRAAPFALFAAALLAGCKPAPAPDPASPRAMPSAAGIVVDAPRQVLRIGFTAIEARVLDAQDKPAAHVAVHWSRIEGPGMLALTPEARGAQHLETRTDAQGRTHIVLRTDRPGVTSVAALLERAADPARRVAIARVDWRDVRVLTAHAAESAEDSARLQVRLEREGDGEPIAGRRLRWTIAEGSAGRFAPRGATQQVTRLDAQGAASVRLLRPEEDPTESVVRLELLDDCPAACAPGTALGLGETRVRWLDAGPAPAPVAEKLLPAPAPVIKPATVAKPEPRPAPAAPGKLEIVKQGPAARYVGQRAGYLIVVRNAGKGPASGVTVSDVIPEGMRWVASRPDASLDPSGEVASWVLGTLAPMEERRIQVTLAARAPARACNVALAAAPGTPGARAEACTEVRGLTALQLEVTDAPDPVVVGETATYRIEVLNQGSAPAHNVAVAAAWPEALRIEKALGAGAQVEGRSLRYLPIPELHPGQRAVYNVSLRALQSGDVRFAVELRADELESPVNETEATRLYE